jgi:hypothetical protein
MLQRYHLLLRGPDGTRVLADRRPLGWLLPIVAADARERAPRVVSRFIERLNVQGTVACITSGLVDRQGTGIDWLAVVDETSSGNVCPSNLQEAAIEDLLGRTAIVPVQSALLRAYQRLCHATPSALSPAWLTDATNWAARFLPDWATSAGMKVTPHRTELFEATWEFRDSTTSFFLKWRGQGSFLDPDVAQIVAMGGGAHVPTTIAHDRENGRWLTQRVHGAPLTSQLSPAVMARVGQTMAHAQISLLPCVQRLRSLGVAEESLADLAAEADRILDCLPSHFDHHEVGAARAAIHRACAELDALRLPATWIHADFVPENVFNGGDAVSFIDFEDPWMGPAPVVMEFLYSGLRRHIPDIAMRSTAISNACEGFVEGWRALIPADVMRQAFASTRLVAEILRISRRLRAVAAKEKNGELVGFVGPAVLESARRLVALANSGSTNSITCSV